MPPRVILTEPVDIAAGWNADIVAESQPAALSTTVPIDASDRVSYSAGLLNSGGLPADGTVVSANESVNYQLSPCDGPNALSLREQNLQGNEAVKALGNVRRDNNSYSADNHYCLFDFSVPADPERMLESVSFRSSNYAYASVMALSRVVDASSGIAAQPVMATTEENRRAYDILGRPLRPTQRGVVIRNGRKYIP